MDKQFFFLSPIEVVKVTSQNLQEAAEWCGGSVQETESRRVEGRMDKYVLVPTASDKNIAWAFPGMFITKRLVVTVKNELKETFAVFRRDYFEKNYFDTPDAAGEKTWIRQQVEAMEKPKKAAVKVGTNLGAALIEAQKRDAEKQADRLMARKSSGELMDLLNAGHITAEDYRRHTGYSGVLKAPVTTPQELKEAIDAGEKRLIHNHKLEETCDENDCKTDRFVDGIHIFSDNVVHANAKGWITTKLEGESEADVERATNRLDLIISNHNGAGS